MPEKLVSLNAVLCTYPAGVSKEYAFRYDPLPRHTIPFWLPSSIRELPASPLLLAYLDVKAPFISPSGSGSGSRILITPPIASEPYSKLRSDEHTSELKSLMRISI